MEQANLVDGWNLHKYTCRSEQIHFASLNKCVLQIATGMQADQYGNFNCPVLNPVAMLQLKSSRF